MSDGSNTSCNELILGYNAAGILYNKFNLDSRSPCLEPIQQIILSAFERHGRVRKRNGTVNTQLDCPEVWNLAKQSNKPYIRLSSDVTVTISFSGLCFSDALFASTIFLCTLGKILTTKLAIRLIGWRSL